MEGTARASSPPLVQQKVVGIHSFGASIALEG